ncbi:MAG: hypothetical protein Q4G13_01020 [Moraxella sp.]|nr:hypothetical protein [Moraxella sp.]
MVQRATPYKSLTLTLKPAYPNTQQRWLDFVFCFRCDDSGGAAHGGTTKYTKRKTLNEKHQANSHNSSLIDRYYNQQNLVNAGFVLLNNTLNPYNLQWRLAT